MKPGYFVGILITLLIVGEYFFFKNKSFTKKEVIMIVIAALAAGAFAGFALEGALSLFRTFMQANVGDTKLNRDLATITSAAFR